MLAQSQLVNPFNSSLLIEVTRPNGIFTCSGVAVSQETLLTAAHCLEGEVTNVRVFYQETYDPVQTHLEIQSFKLHPLYDPTHSDYFADVAKITIKKRFSKLMNLYQIDDHVQLQGELIRIGFGSRNNKNTRTLVRPGLRRIDIRNQILELDDLNSKSGDSGGPVFIQNGHSINLVAIHSTLSYGPLGEYSFNPLLAGYIQWIFEN